MLQGYKTIIAAAVSLVIALIGGQAIDMTPMQHALVNGFFSASYLAIMIFRLVSTTTFGRNIETKIEGDLGITHQRLVDLLAPIIAQMPSGSTMADLVDQMAKVHTAVAEVKAIAAAPPGSTSESTTARVGDVSSTTTVTKVPDTPATMMGSISSAADPSLILMNQKLDAGGSGA